MLRLLLAVIYLTSLVSTSVAQGLRENNPRPEVEGARRRLEAKRQLAEQVEQERRYGITAISDNTRVANREREIKEKIDEMMDKGIVNTSSYTWRVLDDCQSVLNALGLDAYSQLFEKESKNKRSQKTQENQNSNALSESEAKEFLRDLSKRMYQAAQKETGNLAASLALKNKMLVLFPVIKSLGALDPAAEQWAVKTLRKSIRDGMKYCTTSDNEGVCYAVLADMRVFAALGGSGDSLDDAALIEEFLKKSYKGPMAASVLQTGALALVTFGRQGHLFAFMHEVDQEGVGFWDRLGNIFSAEYWTDKAYEAEKIVDGLVSGDNHEGNAGERWVPRASSGSYYTVKEKGVTRYGNIYQDLGEWVSSAKDENGKYLYRDKIPWSYFLHAYVNGIINVDAPAFVTGLLLGGATVPNTRALQQNTSGDMMGSDGKTRFVNSSAEWNAIQQRLNGLHTNTTGFVLAELWAHPKVEMKYAQRAALNNQIMDRYLKVTPVVNGRTWRPKWMEKQNLTSYQRTVDSSYGVAKGAAQVVDIAIAVVGVVTVANSLSVAKLASFGVRTMNKTRYAMALVRAEKGTMNVTQLRNLAQLRIAAKGGNVTKGVAAALNTPKAAASQVKSASGVKAANSVTGTAKAPKAAGGTSSATSGGAKQPLAISPTASTAKNAGATTRSTPAPKVTEPQATLSKATAPKAAAVEPVTSAVSPTQLQGQVTGTLAQRVQEGQSTIANIKKAAHYVGEGVDYAKGIVRDYFKALSRPRRTLQMNIFGPLGAVIPEPGAFSAVRAESAAAAAAKASKAGQVATSTQKAVVAQEKGAAAVARAEASQITPENFLSSKLTGGKYEVRGLSADGTVFTRQMTTQEYRALQGQAKTMGKGESLALRGERNQLQLRRATKVPSATQGGAAEAGAPSGVAISQATERAVQETSAHMNKLKQLGGQQQRLSSQAQESMASIRKAAGSGEGNAQAEGLYASLQQRNQEINQLYKEISEMNWNLRQGKVAGVTEITNQSAQAAQKADRASQLVQEMQSLSEQLRHIEISSEVKQLGRIRVDAQKKLAEIRNLLATANSAKIPPSQTAQLQRALQVAEGALESTKNVAREALAARKEGSLTNAIDKATHAQRTIESAMAGVNEQAQSLRSMWGTELSKATRGVTTAAGETKTPGYLSGYRMELADDARYLRELGEAPRPISGGFKQAAADAFGNKLRLEEFGEYLRTSNNPKDVELINQVQQVYEELTQFERMHGELNYGLNLARSNDITTFNLRAIDLEKKGKALSEELGRLKNTLLREEKMYDELPALSRQDGGRRFLRINEMRVKIESMQATLAWP